MTGGRAGPDVLPAVAAAVGSVAADAIEDMESDAGLGERVLGA